MAKTPGAIINRLNQEIPRALHGREVKDKLCSTGVDATASTPEQLATKMKSEMGWLAS